MVELSPRPCMTNITHGCARLRLFTCKTGIAFSSERVCERAFLVSRERKKGGRVDASRAFCVKNAFVRQVAKSANVSIRIWCWFVIHRKKVHPSTCLKLVRGDRPWPRPLFLPAGLHFRIFSSLDLSSGKKKLEEKKKLRSKSSETSPDLRAPTTQLSPLDFDSTDDRCFSEQTCEQQ
jgi:hypothetical protein